MNENAEYILASRYSAPSLRFSALKLRSYTLETVGSFIKPVNLHRQ